jgi:hypothetical protein
LTIDLEDEVIRSGRFDDGFWTKWTYQFKPMYPRGPVKKVTVKRHAGFAVNVITFDLEGKAPRKLFQSDEWRNVEAAIRRVLSEYNCRPFRID